MKLDEDKNIEVESEGDYKKGKINDCAFTYNPEQNLYTKDLMHCVGLALIDEVKGIRKRGLIHIYYNKEFVRNGDNNIILPDEKVKETYNLLKNFVGDFRLNEEGKKIFKNPKALMVYVRSVPIGTSVEKIVLRNEFTDIAEEKKIKDTDRYENPMADYIGNWLKKKKIELYASQATSNKKLPSVLNMEDDPKEIHHKEFCLGHDRIRIGMYNKDGVLLNKNDYEDGLDF